MHEPCNDKVKDSTYYQALNVLELKDGATKDEIRIAYRRQAKRYHPDMVPDGLANDFRKLAQEKMKAINDAYHILMELNE